MYNLPEGIGKGLDDTNVVCEVCGLKRDVDDSEYIDGEFVCNDCLKEHFVNTEDGYVRAEKYDDWKTDKLRELVKELRKTYMGYFSTNNSDISSIDSRSEILEDIKKLNERVHDFVDDAYFFYIPRHNTTLEQLYHVIDYLCGTELEIK